MLRTPIAAIHPLLTQHGRTLLDADQRLHLNWTCSGISFEFTGSCLLADIDAVSGVETDIRLDNPFVPSAVQRETWPWLAVFLDDGNEPVMRIEVNKASGNYLLYTSQEPETHKVTILKLTENSKGKTAIRAFTSDGSFAPLTSGAPRLRLEFIGDSITCGFGNATHIRDRGFYSAEEDGYQSYAAIAARQLDAEVSIISFSGIAVMPWQLPGVPMPPAMAELYPYTDRLAQELMNEYDNLLEWDFASLRPDIIVVNLGTNDASVIEANGFGLDGQRKFEAAYCNFLQLLREKNGPEPWILCSLGSMDYYLYDNLRNAAEQFASDHEDSKIRCFKFSRIRFMDGYGASAHPNLTTHKRMAKEIADYIEELFAEGEAKHDLS